MQRTMEHFIRALRAADVKVSPAESIDAHRAAEIVGYGERELFRDALCATVAKSAEEVERFDICFETFFTRDEFRSGHVVHTESDISLETMEAAERQSELVRMILEDDVAALAQALEEAAERAGATEITQSTQRNRLARRILEEMGVRGLETQLGEAQRRDDADGRALAERLDEGRKALIDEAGRFMDRQNELYASEAGRKNREKLLAQQKISTIDPHEIMTMQQLVRRMAKRLANRYARQRRKARKGQLDIRRTIRKSMPHGGIPFEIVWKTKKIDRPKIAALCDVSGSVQDIAGFLLLFLYSLHEAVEKLDAFAFSNRLKPVNDILKEQTVEQAIATVMKQMGGAPTDYGKSLQDFCDLHLAKIDRKTTIIVLGDARANYANPRIDLIKTLEERSRAIIWLNPEPESFWTRGDSVMERYMPFTKVTKTCNTLNQLERIIDDVLRSYIPN
jgi:uncharacterized protein with von Willebrand factor type A (vWA) domain